jgi:hypothetical protein
MTGRSQQLTGNDGDLQLEMEPYGSRVVVFRRSSTAPLPAKKLSGWSSKDLSSGWTMTLGPNGVSQTVNLPYSWTASTNTQFFSGTATFTKIVDLSAADASAHVSLNLGEAVPEGENRLQLTPGADTHLQP